MQEMDIFVMGKVRLLKTVVIEEQTVKSTQSVCFKF